MNANSRINLIVLSTVAVLILATCASFDGALQIDTSALPTTYISPKNADGIQDVFEFPIEVPLLYKNMQIAGYRFSVSNSSQQAVRVIEESVEVKKRLFGVKTEGIAIPGKLTWDGRSDGGSFVADGKYIGKVEAWDAFGNMGEAGPITIVVDNTPPYVEVSSPYDIFSPNDDGKLDLFLIRQRNSSPEREWQGRILNQAGLEVLSFNWQGTAVDVEWDGRDDDGNRLSDGVFSYLVSARDLAGNSSRFEIPPFTIDTRPTPITLNLDYTVFSPNGDGVKDVVGFIPYLQQTDNVQRWEIEIRDQASNIVQTLSGNGNPAARIEFNGKSTSGVVLPDAEYSALLSILYRNGDNPFTISPNFIIDATLPKATLKTPYTLFSPDGDGNLDTLPIDQSSSTERLWEGVVTNASGTVVERRFWQGEAIPFVWSALDSTGKKYADGTYNYTLSSTDDAGNKGVAELKGIRLDTRETLALLLINNPAFSPKDGSTRPTIGFLPKLTITEDMESWTLKVVNEAGQVQRNLSGRGSIGNNIPFDGKNDRGVVLPDGRYNGTMSVVYAKGDKVTTTSPTFRIDTIEPTVTLTAEYLIFSPEGDGRKDTITIYQTSSNETEWTGTVLNAGGQEVFRRIWYGRTLPFEWNGKDALGRKVPDGTYTYRISSTDTAENSMTEEIEGIRVDTTATPISVSVSPSRFSPNGDGILDTIAISPSATVANGIKSWTLVIVGPNRRVAKSFSGNSRLPSSITWNGRDNAGAQVADGNYAAELAIEYIKGNVPVQRAGSFAVDTTPPTVSVAINPKPFSPDNDGVDDKVTIRISASDDSGIQNWTAEISDPTGVPFINFTGNGPPQQPIVWNGLSKNNELVQSAFDYPLIVNVTDTLNNRADVKVEIPVDVLVMRLGDRLKIIISSIYFKPYTADYVDVAPELASQNAKTLDRLAEVLKKYQGYRINLEGHAVREYWNYSQQRWQQEEREELLPLSIARSEAVKKALVERGVVAGRMISSGFGGTQPVVPHSDLQNRWKNRRVEFILIKQEDD